MNATVGDQIYIEDKPFTIKQVIPDFDATGPAPDILILPRSTVQQIVFEQSGVKYEATYILIKADKDADILTLANHIRQIDSELRIDVAEENDFLRSNLDALSIFMIVLSMLVLIVTSLLIISNCEAFLYKYKNQLAILRSFGATRMQLFKVVWIQCSFINGIGAALGFLLAIASNQFFHRWFEQFFSFESSVADFKYGTAIIATVVSMSIIQVFMFFPSYRVTKVLPLKIIQENEQNDFSNRKKRKGFGKTLLVISTILILIGIIQSHEGAQAIWFLLAALFLVLGIFYLFPVYLAPILTRISPMLGLLFGKVSYVAVKNVIPQVRKNTFVVLTISTMMMIAVFGSTMFKTIQSSEVQFLKQQYPTEFVVTSRMGRGSTINPYEIATMIKQINNIKSVSTLSTVSSARLKKDNRYVSFDYALGDLKEMEKQGLLPTLPENIDKSIIVTKEFAERNHLKEGDQIELGKYSESAQKVVLSGQVSVALVLDTLPGSPVQAFMDWENTMYRDHFTTFNRAFITLDDDKSALNRLEALKQLYPAEIQVNSYEQSLKKSTQMFYQRWSIFIVVIIVILLSVMLGVFNTLVNNIHSKRKEFAILRTLSVDKKGIIHVIITQVVLYIIIGVILGIVTGALATLIISFIDSGTKIQFDFTLMSIISLILIGMALIIFIPYAKKMGGLNISAELTQDNK